MKKPIDPSKVEKCPGCDGTGRIISYKGCRPEPMICPACGGKRYVKKGKVL